MVGTMNIARATSKIATVRVVNTAIGFASLAFFAQELGAAQMGVYFLFQSLVNVLAIPADLGIRGGIQKRISEGEEPEAYLATGAVLKLVPLATISLLILALAEYINGFLGADLSLLLIIALTLEEYSTFGVVVLKGELNVEKTASIRLINQLTTTAVGVGLVLSGLKAEALVYALIAGQIARLLVSVSQWSMSVGRPSITKAVSLWDFSKYNVLISIGSFIHNWLDVMVIGFFLGQAAVGAYEIAWRVAAVLLLVTRAIQQSIIPQVSAWHADENQSRIRSFIPTSIVVSLLFVLPGVFGVLLLSESLLGIAFGKEYTTAALALIILAVGKIVEGVHIVLANTLVGLNHPDDGAWISVFTAVLNLVLNVSLVPMIGLPGAAIATVASFSVGSFAIGYRLSGLVTFELPMRTVAYLLVPSLGMSAMVYFVRTQVDISTLLELGSIVLLGAVTYFTIIYVISPLRKQVEDAIRNLM